ncbi:MAG: ATPase domain-containing protein [Candidatus Thorarchaeota archaeon]
MQNLTDGGLVERSSILVSGGTGSGTMIFGLQFLYNGVSMYLICFLVGLFFFVAILLMPPKMFQPTYGLYCNDSKLVLNY